MTDLQMTNLKLRLSEVFNEMKDNWGYQLSDQYTTLDWIDRIANKLVTKNISRQLFESACAAAIDSEPAHKDDYPKPGYNWFIQMGRDRLAKDAGYLTAAESFEAIFQAPEVDRNNPPHFGETNPQHKRDIVTWNTVLRIGSARLMTSDKKYTRPDYLKTYADVLRVALSGREADLVASGALKAVPPLKQAQIADKGASKEFALNALEKIKQQQGWA